MKMSQNKNTTKEKSHNEDNLSKLRMPKKKKTNQDKKSKKEKSKKKSSMKANYCKLFTWNSFDKEINEQKSIR